MITTVINIALRAFTAGWNIGQAIWGNASSSAILQNVNLVAAMLSDWINTELWSQYRINTAWDDSVHSGAQGMHDDLLSAFADIGASLNHIVDTIVPISVKTGTNRLWSRVNTMQGSLQSTDNNLSTLYNHFDGLHNWIDSQIWPWTQNYKKFIGLWNKYWDKPVNALVGWYQHPEQLSQILAPSMTQDVVLTISDGKHRPMLDRLLLALLSIAPDVTTAIDKAAVAVLNSGAYPAS